MSNFNQDCSIERIQSISISGFLRDMNLLRKLVNAGVDNTKILTIFKECENLKQNVLRTFIMSSFGGLDENSAKLWYNVVNNSALFREMTTKDSKGNFLNMGDKPTVFYSLRFERAVLASRPSEFGFLEWKPLWGQKLKFEYFVILDIFLVSEANKSYRNLIAFGFSSISFVFCDF